MAKRRKQTPTEKAYKKELNRIKRFIRTAEARGYEFKPSALPKEVKRPTKASIAKLRKLTPEKLYEKARYGGEATWGEIVSGTEGRKAERRMVAEKAAQTRKARKAVLPSPSTVKPIIPPQEAATEVKPPVQPERPALTKEQVSRIVITNFRLNYRMFPHIAPLMEAWLNRLIVTQGEEAVAKMLQKGIQAGMIMTYEIAYNEDKLYNYLDAMMNYLPDFGALSKAEMMDAIEDGEIWEELD